jgi:hypothetical protein
MLEDKRYRKEVAILKDNVNMEDEKLQFYIIIIIKHKKEK